MSDRDDMLLDALSGLLDAKLDNLEKRLHDDFDPKFDQISREVAGVKLYNENVLEKKLNAFYDNTVTITEYNNLKQEVEELKKTVNDILKKIS
jgi:hypothetical protein